MISALFDRLFLLLICGKLRKTCNGLTLRSSEFTYDQLNNIVYLYEFTLNSLDLINKPCTTYVQLAHEFFYPI